MQRPVRKLVRVRVEFTTCSEEEQFTGHGYTVDLNVSGCQIESTTVLPKNRYLTLRLYGPQATEPLQVELARVRWMEGRLFGVEFIRRNSASHRSLRQWISSAVEEGGTDDQADGGITGKSLSILVVEDNPHEMLLYSKVLQNAGHTVLQASGSIEAMQLCLDHRTIDLAIVDVVLTVPEFRLHSKAAPFRRVNGSQLVKDMVALRKQLRAIFMSALGQSQLKDHGVLLGTIPFLKKPFSRDQLIETVARTLTLPPLVWTTSLTSQDHIPWKD